MKVKVALLLDLSEGWLGGVNYYRNLLTAVDIYGTGAIDFFIVVPKHIDESLLDGFPKNLKIYRTSLVEQWSFLGVCRRAIGKIFGKDYIMAAFLRMHDVQLISHSQIGLVNPGIKMIAWIGDFQHKYYPGFFPKEEIRARDCAYYRQAKNSDGVFLSSYNAADDFLRFYPEYGSKIKILQFVPSIQLIDNINGKEVLNKYSLPEKFFYVPNQYWVHKNHIVILQALKILQDLGNKDIIVVSTGSVNDYRVPGYFGEIQGYIKENHLEENYKVLGIIPYDDVQVLAAICHAYINPSFFEGWSTTVEEAKYRGKCILLSDLAVHKEQNPKYGVYFNPNNPEQLAEKMLEVWNADRVQVDEDKLVKMNITMRQRFARCYEDIVKSVI